MPLLNKTPFTIRVLRGLKANLAALLAGEGEPVYTLDEPALYMGDGNFVPLPVVGQVPRVEVDDDYTADVRDYLIAVTVANKTITLPPAADTYNGKTYKVQDELGGADVGTPITIEPDGSDTINAGSSIDIDSAYGGVDLVADGVSNWHARSFGTTTVTGSIYPDHATLWADEFELDSGAAPSNYTAGGQIHNLHVYQTSGPANGDSIKSTFLLAAGNYTMSVLGQSESDAGKLDIEIDGSVVVSGQDWYVGSGANTIKTASVTIATGGNHDIRIIVNGKNASSSNYYYVLTKVWFTPA